MNISLRQLKVFLAVANHGSFSRAGEDIGLTQPAVSRCIRELEQELGLKLVDRTTREVTLTEVGASLSATLARVLDELESALRDTHGLAEERRGRVRVASAPTISANLMPECISACAARYPDITLLLRDQVQTLASDGVRHGEVDFGVIVASEGTEDLVGEPIMVEPFLVVCDRSHRFARQTQVTWEELNGEKLVLLDYASGSRPLIDRALAEHGAYCQVAQEVGHAITVFRMIEAGIGISIMPALALPAMPGLPAHGDRLVALPLVPQLDRTIMLVRRKNRTLSPAAQSVWALIQEITAKTSHALTAPPGKRGEAHDSPACP
ncbi:LysR family transcriptional regulator [Pandoraea cepalis]|uniref:LysR family transcriptional regulator n=1 Tax=Pandoraea cepalis TaxID=2508294 RepID=A0AAW7MQ98_9BURK|nr:LysR family transcriptional regulator [Pandoraea cepalis]MDN4574951.1 LysR family transcriptional regulator [Pandoraea cepalis]MDN4579021.1 LysR family transcriptional regulator [Pandoraea cepalis]